MQELVYFVFSLKGTWLVLHFSLPSELSYCCCKLLLLQDLIKMQRSLFSFIESFCLHYCWCIINFLLLLLQVPVTKEEGKLLRLFSYDCKLRRLSGKLDV